MNIKTNLLVDYVNFVDITKKQNRYFKIILSLFVLFFYSFVFIFCFFKSIFDYVNE